MNDYNKLISHTMKLIQSHYLVPLINQTSYQHRSNYLIINDCHETTKHGGVSWNLSQLREIIWILSAKQSIKCLIFKCNLYEKLRVKSCTQIPVHLSVNSLKEAYPLQVTSLDYLWPVFIKDLNERKKTYILLITCVITRAVHLDLTPEFTSKTIIQAFIKFVGKRGNCSNIYIDDAKIFHKAKEELYLLCNIIKNEDVQNLLSGLSVKWNFIVEREACWGVFFVCLVRSVKMSLIRFHGKRSVSFKE